MVAEGQAGAGQTGLTGRDGQAQTGAARRGTRAEAVRFQPVTGLDSRVPAGRTATFPVTVEGAARSLGLRTLAVYVSYDHGRTWKKTEVGHGRIIVRNPARGKRVCLRAKITDKKGNTSTISVFDTYYGK